MLTSEETNILSFHACRHRLLSECMHSLQQKYNFTGVSLESLSIDKPYLIQIDDHGNINIKEVRQPCDYITVQNLFRVDRFAFANYVKPPCALPRTKECLEHLFRNSTINQHLLDICRFKGHARSLSWTTFQTFSELLSLVPKELARVLGRLAVFWDNVAGLTECRLKIYQDTESIEKVSGLWPARCSADKNTLKELKNLFPGIAKKQKNMILKYIQESESRVPTMRLVISEATFFLCIAKGVNERLKIDGNGFRLRRSEIRKDDKTALDEHAYIRCFLDAAQHVNDIRVSSRHPPQDHDVVEERTTNCRKVTGSANFWRSGTSIEVFNEKTLRRIQPRYVKGHPPVCLLVKDFLESFWGPFVPQDLEGKASQDQLNDRLSALMRASEFRETVNGSTQESSEWNSSKEHHDSRFILKPFTFDSQAIRDYRPRRQLCSTKAPDYASEKGDICSPGTLREVHLHRRSKELGPVHTRTQDVRLYSEDLQAFDNQYKHLPENDFEELSSDHEEMVRHPYEFRRQARVSSKTVSGVFFPHGSKNDVNGVSGESYGPFRISCLEDIDSAKSRKFDINEASSMYSSGDGSTQCGSTLESDKWDVQTFVPSEKEKSIDERLDFVEHKSETERSLYEMLGIKFAQIDGRRVFIDARCNPLRYG